MKQFAPRRPRRRFKQPPMPSRRCVIISDDGAYWAVGADGLLVRVREPAFFPSHVSADRAIWKTIEAWGKERPGIRLRRMDA